VIIRVPFQWIGNRILSFFREIGYMAIMLFRIFLGTFYVLRHRHLVLKQMLKIGVNSLPLVSVVSIFTGAVSSWQAAYQFEGFAPGLSTYDYLGAAVSYAILIELSPVLTGLVIAGRVGASIAAELGTMRVTEQIDALETLAIDPVNYLAAPRFTAGWTMLPVLVIYSNLIAHLGAFIVALMLLGISTSTFFSSIQRHFLVYNVFSGLVKALIFGGGTALVGCSIGFRTEGGAEGVGHATIKAFVFSSAFILISDYILAVILF
jgi:phospholipid/cholesterol/gamma-HCH transport system permease protein